MELLGLYWYAREQLQGEHRSRLAARLRAFAPGGACPFLLDGACAVHPMRPMACRNFNVFDRRCDEGEDAYHTRRSDVMEPIRRHMERAFDLMLPFHGMTHKAQRRQAVKKGGLHTMARVLQELEWHKLAERMEPSAGR
jgi:hypothetical protein